jgi:hypothetical protein
MTQLKRRGVYGVSGHTGGFKSPLLAYPQPVE